MDMNTISSVEQAVYWSSESLRVFHWHMQNDYSMSISRITVKIRMYSTMDVDSLYFLFLFEKREKLTKKYKKRVEWLTLRRMTKEEVRWINSINCGTFWLPWQILYGIVVKYLIRHIHFNRWFAMNMFRYSRRELPSSMDSSSINFFFLLVTWSRNKRSGRAWGRWVYSIKKFNVCRGKGIATPGDNLLPWKLISSFV